MRLSTPVRTAVIATLALALVGGVAVTLATGHASPRPASSTAATTGPGPRAPSWSLTDMNGRHLSSADLSGKVRVVTFLFPFCTTYCPATARSLAQLEDQLSGTALADSVEIVAFNVDPAGADRAAMRAFWRHFGGNPKDPSVAFVTGAPATIRHVVTDGYKVAYQKETDAQQEAEKARAKKEGTYVPQPEVPNPVASKAAVGYDVVHNDVLEIVGRDGRIDKVFANASQVPAPTLLAAVRTVAAS